MENSTFKFPADFDGFAVRLGSHADDDRDMRAPKELGYHNACHTSAQIIGLDAGKDQIGAAVRDIHRKCQAALKEHLTLEPVLAQEEGSSVEVPVGFDPSAIRLIGNVTGQPPFKGTLQHHGWRMAEAAQALGIQRPNLYRKARQLGIPLNRTSE